MGNRFSLWSLLALVTFVCLLMASLVQPETTRTNDLVTLALIEVVVFVAVVETLTANIPSSLKEAMRQNSIRWDGTISERRKTIESRSLKRLRWELQKTCLIVLTLTNSIVALLHFELIPLPIAFRAVASAQPSSEAWQAELQDEAREYERWLAPSTTGTEARKQMEWLWNVWPVIGASLFGWLFFAGAFLVYAYSYGLRELAAGIRYRAERYKLLDLHESTQQFEMESA